MPSMPKIEISDLQRKAAESKSAATARYYVAMLKRLEDYNRSETIDLGRVDADYVAGFGDYLIGKGVTVSTAKLFKMALRATMKEAFGKELKQNFKEAFREVGSKNEPVNSLAYEDVVKLWECDLSNNILLEKTRLIFLFGLFGGGLTFRTLKHRTKEDNLNAYIPQQALILRKYESNFGNSMLQSLNNQTENQFETLLAEVGRAAQLKYTLKPDSATDGWISCARKARIRPSAMAAVLPADHEFVRLTSKKLTLPAGARSRVLKAAANTVLDLQPHWFVMKCRGIDPEEVENKLSESGTISEHDDYAGFIPPDEEKESNRLRNKVKQADDKVKNKKNSREIKDSGKEISSKAGTRKSIMNGMYFFHCTSVKASEIRKVIREYAWVYTLAGTSIPAQISDAEMRTFMLLCDIAEDSLDYHFDESKTTGNSETGFDPSISIGTQAEIVNGPFRGHVGIISSLPNNKYKVEVTFSSLSARITATVPLSFLHFSPN